METGAGRRARAAPNSADGPGLSPGLAVGGAAWRRRWRRGARGCAVLAVPAEGRRRRSCAARAGKRFAPVSGVVALRRLGSWSCEETGRVLSHRVPLRATRAIGKRVKMEGEGGGAGTSGDSGGDGGEQLLTVKHELRTGERPRPLPAGPAAEARLRAGMGARTGRKGRGLGVRAPGRVLGGSGQGEESLLLRDPQFQTRLGKMPSCPPSCLGDISVTTRCLEGKVLFSLPQEVSCVELCVMELHLTLPCIPARGGPGVRAGSVCVYHCTIPKGQRSCEMYMRDTGPRLVTGEVKRLHGPLELRKYSIFFCQRLLGSSPYKCKVLGERLQ